jgi:small conductance mechanosensitive channel
MDWYMNLIEQLKDNLPARLLLIVLLAVILQGIIKQVLAVVVRRAIRRHHYPTLRAAELREQTVTSILGAATAILLWIIVILLILAEFGVNIGAVATGAGLAGVIIGFGAQSTIKNLLSGLFILLENQYRVGDVVTINSFSGVVEEVTIRITRLRDLDGNVHIVQNGDITVVTNHTFGFSNVNVDIGVAYDSPLDAVETAINQTGQALADDLAWKDRILEPIHFLRIDAFGDSAIIIKCLGKVAPAAQWDVAGEFRKRLKKAFDKAGIEIPFPQRVIHQAAKPAKHKS